MQRYQQYDCAEATEYVASWLSHSHFPKAWHLQTFHVIPDKHLTILQSPDLNVNFRLTAFHASWALKTGIVLHAMLYSVQGSMRVRFYHECMDMVKKQCPGQEM